MGAWLSSLFSGIGMQALRELAAAFLAWFYEKKSTDQNIKDQTTNAEIEEKVTNAKTKAERQAALDAAARKFGRRD